MPTVFDSRWASRASKMPQRKEPRQRRRPGDYFVVDLLAVLVAEVSKAPGDSEVPVDPAGPEESPILLDARQLHIVAVQGL